MNEEAPSGSTAPLSIHQLVTTAGTPHALLPSNTQTFCHTLMCKQCAKQTLEISLLKASRWHSNTFHGEVTSINHYRHLSSLLQHKCNSSNKSLFLLLRTSLPPKLVHLPHVSCHLTAGQAWKHMVPVSTEHTADLYDKPPRAREALDYTVDKTTANTLTAGGKWQNKKWINDCISFFSNV